MAYVGIGRYAMHAAGVKGYDGPRIWVLMDVGKEMGEEMCLGRN